MDERKRERAKESYRELPYVCMCVFRRRRRNDPRERDRENGRTENLIVGLSL